jgi:hypothetical protein
MSLLIYAGKNKVGAVIESVPATLVVRYIFLHSHPEAGDAVNECIIDAMF